MKQTAKHRTFLMTRRLVSVLGVFVLLAVSLTPGTAAASQRAGSIELVNQVAAIKPGRQFTMNLLMQGGSNDHLISASVFAPVANRDEFALQIRGFAEFGEPLFTLDPVAVQKVRSGRTAGTLSLIVLEISTSDNPNSKADLLIEQPGVYPVIVTLADPDGSQQDELLTYLVIAPRGQQCPIVEAGDPATDPPDTDPPDTNPPDTDPASGDGAVEPESSPRRTPRDCVNPLRVNITLPLQASPALQPDQSSFVSESDRTQMRTIVDVIASRPSMDLTIAVVPESVVALESNIDDIDLLTQLSVATAQREVLRLPYVNVDEEGWRRANIEEVYTKLLRAGDRVLERDLGVGSIVTAAYLDSDADPNTLAMLATQGYDRFLVADTQLSPLPPAMFPFPVTQQFEIIDADGKRQPTAAVDTALGQHFGANDNEILDAHNFIAELALLWFDQPDITRGVVVRPSREWDVDDNVLTLALSGITATPIFRAVSLEMYFDEVSVLPSAGHEASKVGKVPRAVRRELVPTGAPEDLVDFANRYAQTEATLESYEEIVGGRTPESAPLRELLLVAGARGVDFRDRLDYLQAVDDAVDDVARLISGPGENLVSITAREANIPFSIVSELAGDAQVVLRLSSNKLEFPDGPQQSVVLSPGRNDLTVGVKSRSSGDANLRISVMSPDGSIQLAAPSTIVVRSTVFSGLGLLILVAALIILAIWWLQQFRGNDTDTRDTGDTDTSELTHELPARITKTT